MPATRTLIPFPLAGASPAGGSQPRQPPLPGEEHAPILTASLLALTLSAKPVIMAFTSEKQKVVIANRTGRKSARWHHGAVIQSVNDSSARQVQQ
jgi:hypothetical protein